MVNPVTMNLVLIIHIIQVNPRCYKREVTSYYLAVDEFAIHKGHSYATCVMDLDTGDVIWAGLGRALKDSQKFFDDVPSDYLSVRMAV